MDEKLTDNKPGFAICCAETCLMAAEKENTTPRYEFLMDWLEPGVIFGINKEVISPCNRLVK